MATVTFTNSNPFDLGNLADPVNWDLDRQPGAGDIAVIGTYSFSGIPLYGILTAQEIEIAGPQTFLANVQMNALSEFSVAGNVQFESGTIIVNTGTELGNFDVGGGTFMQTGGTVISNSGVLVGRTGGDGSYFLMGGTLQASFETIDGPFAGSFQQSGTTTNTIDGVLTVDTASGYGLLGGTLSAQAEAIGDASAGQFSQADGSNDIGGDLNLGVQQGSNGGYGLQGGTLSVAGNEFIGVLGDGVFDQTGGENAVQGGIILGRSGGPAVGDAGIYHLAGGAVSAQFETIGDASVGQFAQSANFGASSNSVAGTLTLGNQQGSSGSYDLTGGTLAVGGAMVVGLSGSGEVDQGGGAVHLDNGTPNSGVILGLNEGASGRYDLHDDGRLFSNFLVIGRGGEGEFDIANGAVAEISGDVKLGVQVNQDQLKSNGSLEVMGAGSTLDGGALNVGLDGSGHLDVQAGGFVRAGAVNLGVNDGSNAVADITDADSQVSVKGTGNFVIAAAGSAELKIENGASVTADRVLLATQADGKGEADITGAGTVVHATHTSAEQGSGIVVGLGGQAQLLLENGALLQSDWNMAVGGSSGSEGAVSQTGGTAMVSGTLTVAAFAGSSGVYDLDGGVLQTDNLVINSGGIVEVCGGLLKVTNVTISGGMFEIGGGTLAIAGPVSGGPISFDAPDCPPQGPATLKIGDVAAFNSTIVGVHAGDTIDLVNQSVVSEIYNGGTLTLTLGDGQTASLTVSGDFTGLGTVSDGNNGSDVVFTSPASPIAFSPLPPQVSIALANDTGLSNSDLVTYDDTLKGGGDANATVHFAIDGVPIEATATADANGNWTFVPTGLADGTHTVNASETNADGSIGTAILTFTLDTAAPATALALVDDTGASPADGITGDAALSGSGDPNATVHFTVDGVAIADTATADAAGHWTFLPSGLANGTHTIVASETDAAGNVGSASLSFTLDTTPPAPTEMLAHDSGVSSSDRITNDPSLTGSGDPDAVVHFTVDGTPVSDTAVADVSGTWSFAPSGLSDGTHTIVASETDIAGNTGSASLTFTLDTTAPSAAITSDTSGKHGSFVLAGTAEAGSTVDLFDGTAALGHVTAGANGQWTFTLASLSDALHSFTAAAVDAAGNTGQASGAALYGSSGNDAILGTSGNDLITGNKGADTFDFSAANFGNDIISDFTPHSPDHDVLEFNHAAFANAADVMSHAQQIGHDVIITQDAHDTVTLANVNIHQLNAADFYIV
jgi:T5SS/PEP-CTERM-associated repeat protein